MACEVGTEKKSVAKKQSPRKASAFGSFPRVPLACTKARQKDDAFMALFSDWLKARADIDAPREYVPDEEANARTNQAENLARLITVAPAPSIWHKFEVLEHYSNFYGESTKWIDSRETVMLAGIKDRPTARALNHLSELTGSCP